MSTITGLYANAITPVVQRPHNDAAHNQNASHEQFSQTSFTPVEANKQNDASASASGQRPANDQSRQNNQNVQNEHNQAQSAKESKDSQVEEQTDKSNERQLERKEQAQLKEQQQIVSQLKTRDAEVRSHEQAHKNVGGKYTGEIQYEYTKGPDGNNYAVGGEVPISISELSKPELTVQKMQQVRDAALAPAEPSAQDRTVAAKATQIEIKAYADIAKMERVEEEAKAQDKEEYEKESDDISESEDKKIETESTSNSNELPDIGVEDFEVPTVEPASIRTSPEYAQSSGLNLDVIA